MNSRRLAGARLRLTWVGLLVVTLLCVPTLVRATQSLNRDTASIRLNRGFDAPESKCRVSPPVVLVSAAVLVTVPAPRATGTAPSVEVPLFSPRQHDVSPSVLRGPPLTSSNS